MQAGFRELYGDKYHIDVVDLATHHSPYPFNQASKSYNTMVPSPPRECQIGIKLQPCTNQYWIPLSMACPS